MVEGAQADKEVTSKEERIAEEQVMWSYMIPASITWCQDELNSRNVRRLSGLSGPPNRNT
jgi:hypothetical protein